MTRSIRRPLRARAGTWLLATGVAGAVATLGAQLADLTPTQREAVDRGELVVTTHTGSGSPWPAVTVYAFIDATPEEATAIFTDYERHATYIPSIIRSHISRVIDSVTVEVDYTLAIPLVSDEAYTVRDRITRVGADHYRVDWELVRASSTKQTTGHARFSVHRNTKSARSGTLMEYHNFVTPGSRLAALGFVRSRSIAQVRETARAIARHIVTERGNAAMMRRRLALLRNAIGATR